MDIAALSEENVNVADWVNSTLQKTNGQPNKEAAVSSLVAKLQLYVQQVNSALEDTSQQVLASMPRIVKDAQNLHTESRQLKSKMAEVQKNIYQVHKETGACMANLERLDSMKTKLVIAKEGLQESDGWGKLVAELEDFFEQNEMTKACDKLNALQRSLVAQVGLPGQSEREVQIEGFKNRLEALASPTVVQCFTNNDVEQSKKFVDIFDGMHRLPQLIQYYITVQKQILQQHWNETIDLSQNSNSTQFLREFYDYLFESYQKHRKWGGSVFGASGIDAPVAILIEFLLNMQPSRENTIVNVLKRSDEKLVILQDFSNANLYLGKKLLSTIDVDGDTNVELLNRLADAVYGYFGTFIGQSASFEQNWLASKFSELSMVHSTASESVRALGSANSKIFQWTNETLHRCAIISHNCGLPSIVIVLTEFFKSILEKYKKAQQQLNASQGNENDWNLLQTCISLLQHVGDFRLKLSEFEEKLSKIVKETANEFDNNSNSSSITHLFSSYKLADKRSRNDFQKLVKSAETLSTFEKRGGIFVVIFDQIKPICEYVHDTTLASIFAPIEKQMTLTNILPESVQGEAGSNNDLPHYSFAPQEFITVIGQYLLTLPQHLEPLLLTPNQQLKAGLELCDERYGRNNSTNEACADILLSLLVEECTALYTSRISQMHEISAGGAKQVACDIEYLGSVVEELGQSLSNNLQQTIKLLRAPVETYLEESAGCDPHLVTSIRQIRKIMSTD